MRRFALLVSVLFLAAACGGTPYVRTVLFDEQGPYGGMYLSSIQGAENLAFDGEGHLFVTTVHGDVYSVVPSDDPRQGQVVAKRHLGMACFGVAPAPGGDLYVAVQVGEQDRRILRLDSELTGDPVVLTGHIPGLNGILLREGYLYYTTSNEAMTPAAMGSILRVNLAEGAWGAPETVVAGTGYVNGVAFAPDGATLYYTETFSGLWAYDVATGVKSQIMETEALGVVDGLTVSEDGTVWFCSNSQKAVIPVRNGGVRIGFHIDGMGAPSACKFGKGPGFDANLLYVTELSRRSRCRTFDGRGVWTLPVDMVNYK